MFIIAPATTWLKVQAHHRPCEQKREEHTASNPAQDPIQGLPASQPTHAAKKAPTSMTPSMAILVTPLRSQMTAASAANVTGVARRTMASKKLWRKKL